jgi:ferrous iron transport protein A
MAVGQPCTVVGLLAPAQRPEWAVALDDLGFVPGESVQLMARGLPGGDPLVVRVGCSTYALRSAEAACVLVQAQEATR